MEVIFDLFEYSEDEKAMLVKEKKKKFWGILWVKGQVIIFWLELIFFLLYFFQSILI